MSAPAVLNVHTPTQSFAIVHSITQENLETLYDKLTRKTHTEYHGDRVGPGWLKYEFNETVWNLDDDSDYTIFVWRQQQDASHHQSTLDGTGSSQPRHNPTLHLHNPTKPLPSPLSYLNPAFYLFSPSRALHPGTRSSSVSPKPRSSKSRKSKASKHTINSKNSKDDGLLTHQKAFEKFHGENGVRTVMGSIGPVQNVRMLLKSGYRHVYISRKFAMKHAFIPADAAPGHYGYGGLVNIGTWPITLTPSSSFNSHPDAPPPPPVNGKGKHTKKQGPKPTMITVFLSEEPHFDVVLGRSFFERRQIRTNALDPTDVVCLDTGEKLECELVILKDGRGEIVTVT